MFSTSLIWLIFSIANYWNPFRIKHLVESVCIYKTFLIHLIISFQSQKGRIFWHYTKKRNSENSWDNSNFYEHGSKKLQFTLKTSRENIPEHCFILLKYMQLLSKHLQFFWYHHELSEFLITFLVSPWIIRVPCNFSGVTMNYLSSLFFSCINANLILIVNYY